MFIKNLMANIHMVILKKNLKKLILLNQKIPRIFIDVKLLIQIKILNIKKNFIRYRRWFWYFCI